MMCRNRIIEELKKTEAGRERLRTEQEREDNKKINSQLGEK